MSQTYAPFRNLPGILAAGESKPIPNIGTPERVGSAIIGLASFAGGVKCRGPLGGILTLAGAYLIYRGVTGRCEGYRRLGIDTAGNSDGRGVPQDMSQAVRWFIRAARQGDKTAQHNLGVYYATQEAKQATAADEGAEPEEQPESDRA